MGTKIYLSTLGHPVDPEQATVSVFDRGFLYGDSVYETMRTAGGRPLELDRHLARLRRSAEGIALRIPFSPDDVAAAAARTHEASGNAESTLRVVVTRGRGRPLVLDPRHAADPLLVIYALELQLPSLADYERGLAVAIVGAHKVGSPLLDPGVKSGNYLGSVIALAQARERAADDAILCGPDGAIAEGATSNVFMVEGGRIATPDLATGLLAGITREVVCELAAELAIPVAQRRIDPDELRGADEVFLTSSVRGIMPVTELDGRRLSGGRMGAVTRSLFERYAAYVDTSAGARCETRCET